MLGPHHCPPCQLHTVLVLAPFRQMQWLLLRLVPSLDTDTERCLPWHPSKDVNNMVTLSVPASVEELIGSWLIINFINQQVIVQRFLCACSIPLGDQIKCENRMLLAQLCPTLRNPMDCSPPRSPVHGISQARRLEWVDFPFSRGIILTQGSNPGLLHCRQILYLLSHQGSPIHSIGWAVRTYFLSLSSFYIEHLLSYC